MVVTQRVETREQSLETRKVRRIIVPTLRVGMCLRTLQRPRFSLSY